GPGQPGDPPPVRIASERPGIAPVASPGVRTSQCIDPASRPPYGPRNGLRRDPPGPGLPAGQGTASVDYGEPTEIPANNHQFSAILRVGLPHLANVTTLS